MVQYRYRYHFGVAVAVDGALIRVVAVVAVVAAVAVLFVEFVLVAWLAPPFQVDQKMWVLMEQMVLPLHLILLDL